MNFRWITSGIAGGGVVSIRGPIPGNRMVIAKIIWDGDGDLVSGKPSTTIQGALENLEYEIMKLEEKE